MSIRTLTQEDPIGLAGGLNLYGFAGGDPINFADPFGLCPDGTGKDGKQTTNVQDCPNTNVGNAWRALDESGERGQAVIQGVVDGGITVKTGSTQAACKSPHGCYDPGAGSITVNGGDASGVIAVSIAHEFTHSTQARPSTAFQMAQYELEAWDQSRLVYYGMQGQYKKDARATFGYGFSITMPGTQTRIKTLGALWGKYYQEYGLP